MSNTVSCLLPENIAKVTKRDGGPHSLTEFDPKSTALIVIDMQNFYIAKDQLSYCEYAEPIVPNVNKLAMAMRQFGGKVIWVRNITNPEAFKGWSAHYERMTPERISTRKKELAVKATPRSTRFAIRPLSPARQISRKSSANTASIR
jgi:hypothetical protein